MCHQLKLFSGMCVLFIYTILQAATFNYDIVYAVASAIGDEVRAKVYISCTILCVSIQIIDCNNNYVNTVYVEQQICV